MKSLTNFIVEELNDIEVIFKGKSKEKRKIILTIDNKKYTIDKYDNLPCIPNDLSKYEKLTRKLILENWYWFFGWDISAKDFYNHYKYSDAPYTLEDEYDEIERSLNNSKTRYLRNNNEFNYLKKNIISDYYKNKDKYPTFFDIKKLLVSTDNTEYNVKESLLNVHSNFFENISYEQWLGESFDEVKNISEEQFYSNKYLPGKDFYQFKPNYLSYSKAINEKLKDSLVINDNIKSKILSFKGVTNITFPYKKKLSFIISIDKNFNKDKFTHYANFLGYAISYENSFEILYEASIPRKIKCNDKYLYHVTSENKVDKILKYGLIPKSNKNENDGLRYPERIYIWKENTDKVDMKMFYNLRFGKGNFVLLKIDLEQMKNDGIDISLYTDPAYNIKSALFTLEPIKTKYITKI